MQNTQKIAILSAALGYTSYDILQASYGKQFKSTGSIFKFRYTLDGKIYSTGLKVDQEGNTSAAEYEAIGFLKYKLALKMGVEKCEACGGTGSFRSGNQAAGYPLCTCWNCCGRKRAISEEQVKQLLKIK